MEPHAGGDGGLVMLVMAFPRILCGKGKCLTSLMMALCPMGEGWKFHEVGDGGIYCLRSGMEVS